MDQTALEQSQAIRKAATEEAIDWDLLAQARGVTPITTITAAALLIGKIIGSQANNEAHAEFGLEQMMGIMRATAKDWLGVRMAARH